MIRLNAEMELRDEADRVRLMEAALELVQCSRRDAGCIDYDLYQSMTHPDKLLIFETWESPEALKAHSEAKHFLRLVPMLKKYANMNTRRFDIEEA